MQVKKIAVIFRPGRPVQGVVDRVLQYLVSRNCTVYISDEALCRRHGLIFRPEETLTSEAQVLVVVGGDGTLLRGVHVLGNRDIPVLGINAGKLGFLTETETPDMFDCLERVLAGDYNATERRMLKVTLFKNGKPYYSQRVLNDAVINKSALSPIALLEVRSDDELISAYRGDGLIISTPTGSTAYNMAAGGPVLYPTLKVFTITPICPHTFANRPVVIPDSKTIRIKALDLRGEVFCSLDGRTGFPLEQGDEVEVRRARRPIRLIRSDRRGYFDILRHKLGWGK